MITLVVALCHQLVAGAPTPVCVEEQVTNSDLDPSLNLVSCQMFAQPGIAQWQEQNPKYLNWKVVGWKCVNGKFNPANAA